MPDEETDEARIIALYGTDEPAEQSRRLTAGRLSAEFEAGSLRAIRWHGIEVLRAISFVIRDTRWGTYASKIRDLEIGETPDRFAVFYRAECAGPEGRFEYEATIVGQSEGSLRFGASGLSRDGFHTNRTGFVVLHGLDGAVNKPLHVTHVSGGTSRTAFPDLVRPDQPVFDIAGLNHEPAPGLSLLVAFEGDAFEMEDHRNWTDASFKTYVRPLARGYPYRLEPGEPLRQAITLQVSGRPASSPPLRGGSATLLWGDPDGTTMPRVGLFVDQDTVTPAITLVPQLAGLHPGYLQARLDLRGSGPERLLGQYKALAEAVGCSLALEVVIPGLAPLAELAPLAVWMERAGVEPESLFVVPARDLASRAANQVPDGEAGPEAVLAAARHVFARVALGGGVPVGFAELNRNRPPPGIDFVAHATQAIVHAADDASVMETLGSIPDVIRTTRSFAGRVPYRLGPATIGMPVGWSASQPVANPANRRMPVGLNDPRQRGLFAAAFMIGYAEAARDVAALTLAAPSGPFGLFQQPQDWPTPGNFQIGAPYPAAEAFAGVAALSGKPRLKGLHDAPGRLAAVAGLTPSGPVLWLANLTSAPLAISLRGPATSKTRILDAAHLPGGLVETGPGQSVTLDSYALACLF